MSDMMFREPNQVKWQGSRPGHNGTQVLEGAIIGAINFTILYTVPVGTRFFMTYAGLSNYLNIGGNRHLCIYDAGGVIWRVLFGSMNVVNVPSSPVTATFNPPIELAAAFSIRVYQQALMGTIASVHGWVE